MHSPSKRSAFTVNSFVEKLKRHSHCDEG